MGDCLVSIVVPVHDAAGTLPRCLDALAAQTHRNIEVLLVDDGSADGSLALCEERVAADSRFRVLALPHRGVAAARNAALDAWSGDCLMFADADDLVDARYVERLLEVLEATGASVVTCLADDVWGDPPSGWSCPDAPGEPRRIPLADYDFTTRWSHRVVWGALLTRETVAGLRFDEGYRASTDTLLMAQVIRCLDEVWHVDERLYCYAMRKGSVSKGAYGWRRFDDVLVWERVAELFADAPEVPRCSSRAMVSLQALKGLQELSGQQGVSLRLAWELARRVRRWRTVPRPTVPLAGTRQLDGASRLPLLRYLWWRLRHVGG